MTVLERLLAATPLPPTECEIEELIAKFTAMHEARQRIIEELGPVTGPIDPALKAELVDRHARWQAALEAATRLVHAQRRGIRQMRSYANGI
jgi:hypothetical protein